MSNLRLEIYMNGGNKSLEEDFKAMGYSENQQKVSCNTIPGTTQFVGLDKDKIPFFNNKSAQKDFKVEFIEDKVRILNKYTSQYEYISQGAGKYEVTYPNGIKCSKLFENEQDALEFVCLVKDSLNSSNK